MCTDDNHYTYSNIIYHAYYSKHHNQPAYCFNNVKTSYMLDFHEVFWYAEKCGKNAESVGKHAENAEKLAENAENHVENCGF